MVNYEQFAGELISAAAYASSNGIESITVACDHRFEHYVWQLPGGTEACFLPYRKELLLSAIADLDCLLSAITDLYSELLCSVLSTNAVVIQGGSLWS